MPTKIPGLDIISKNDYTGNMELPGDVQHILVGSPELKQLPNYPVSDFLGEYGIADDVNFAVDFSNCRNLSQIPTTFFSENPNIICADLSGCNNVEKIEEGTFYWCDNLKNVTIPENITEIGNFAFDSTSLESIDLSHTQVHTIGKCAFNCDIAFNNILLPHTLKNIDDFAFAECYNLKNIQFPDEIKKVSATAFKNSGVKQIDVAPQFDDVIDGVLIRKNGEVSVSQYIRRGINYKMSGNYEAAMADFNTAIEIDKNCDSAYYNRAIICELLGDNDLAVENLTRAIEINPECKNYHLRRGIIRLDKKEYEPAIQDLRNATKIDNKYKEAYLNLGLAYMEIDKYSMATKAFGNVLQIDPNNKLARLNRGICYMGRDMYDYAYKDFDTVIKSDPNNKTALFYRGSILYSKDMLNEAIRDFDKVTQIDPKDTQSYFNLGIIYSEKGDIDSAIQNYTKAIHLDNNFKDAYFNRGKLHKQNGDPELAVNDFYATLKLDPQCKEARNLIQQTHEALDFLELQTQQHRNSVGGRRNSFNKQSSKRSSISK